MLYVALNFPSQGFFDLVGKSIFAYLLDGAEVPPDVDNVCFDCMLDPLDLGYPGLEP